MRICEGQRTDKVLCERSRLCGILCVTYTTTATNRLATYGVCVRMSVQGRGGGGRGIKRTAAAMGPFEGILISRTQQVYHVGEKKKIKGAFEYADR